MYVDMEKNISTPFKYFYFRPNYTRFKTHWICTLVWTFNYRFWSTTLWFHQISQQSISKCSTPFRLGSTLESKCFLTTPSRTHWYGTYSCSTFGGLQQPKIVAILCFGLYETLSLQKDLSFAYNQFVSCTNERS